MDYQDESGRGYIRYGGDFRLPGDHLKGIKYLEKHLKNAIRIGDLAAEGEACGNLGNAYQSLGDHRKAIEYLEKHLKIAIEIGDRHGEGTAYGYLGGAYYSLGDYRKAIKYFKKHLKIAMEIGDRRGEGAAYGNLGTTYNSLGDSRKAIEYLEKHLKIAIETGDRHGEGAAYGNLGTTYMSLGDYRKAIEYLQKRLKITIEIGDRGGEGNAYGNLGATYNSLGDYRKAIEYLEKRLKIAIEIGDRRGEGAAYGNLGPTYSSLGDHRKAIEYLEKHLKIAIEIGDRHGEGTAYGNLGAAYASLDDYRKAIEYLEKHLKIAIEIGDRRGEGAAYENLGATYRSLGDYRKAIEYVEKHLKIAIQIGDRGGEGAVYGNLAKTYISLGDYRKAIEYLEKRLKIAIEIGDRRREGSGYGGLGATYKSLGNYRKAIEYFEKHLKIAIEIGDGSGEGTAYGNLATTYNSLGDYGKAIEYFEKHLKIAIEIGNRSGEGTAYGNLGATYNSLGDYRKAIEYLEKRLKIAVEIGDQAAEGITYQNIGSVYNSLEEVEKAVDNLVYAVNIFNSLRSLLKSKDNWKIRFRELHETAYTALWMSLLRIGKVDEALSAAEQGRAQTLSDNLLIQYNLSASLSAATMKTKETIPRSFIELITPTIFLAIEGLTIYIWFLSRGNKVVFRKVRLEGDRTEKDPLHTLLQSSLETVGIKDTVRCEDRTFDELDNECPFSIGMRCEGVAKPQLPPLDNPFKPFYDAVIGPIVDMLGPQDDELVIVSDGVLSCTPWAAVIESIRIRTVPSLTSYQLILSVSEGHHKKTGALLVGNPCLNKLKKPLPDLPCAQEEVGMIASILNTRPLTGRQATKAEVMRRMSSVGLIHIAAHGDELTGEIALSPNPGWISKFPQRKDYILKMSDVQAANLRARLVVLSCCHSGRGRILKGEGVVGIARAFLAAGARSVLVTLWAIDDEATMVFMKSFYQHLKEGKTASAAVQQSMKSLRESEEYSEMRYWAPFQLIGDNVKIEFEADDDVKK